MRLSVLTMPWGEVRPVCVTDPPYERLGEALSDGAGSSKSDGYRRAYWACNKVAAGALPRVTVGVSEGYTLQIATPAVEIECHYTGEGPTMPYGMVTQELPFGLFRHALDRWRAFVRSVERGAGAEPAGA